MTHMYMQFYFLASSLLVMFTVCQALIFKLIFFYSLMYRDTIAASFLISIHNNHSGCS